MLTRFFPFVDLAPVVYMGGVLSSLAFHMSLRLHSKMRTVLINTAGILYGVLLLFTVSISAFRADLTVCLFALVPPLAPLVLQFLYRRAGRETSR